MIVAGLPRAATQTWRIPAFRFQGAPLLAFGGKERDSVRCQSALTCDRSIRRTGAS